MSEQVLVQARVDKNLKMEVSAIYEALGMDLPTAIRMFFIRTCIARGIPFSTVLPEGYITRKEALGNLEELFKEAEDVPEMTLDEINDEIADVRLKRRKADK